MGESLVKFGSNDHLVGVVGDASVPGADKPGVIFLNSGLMHKVGMSRITVNLSRHLNALGYNTLRFDLSGIGDSPVSEDEESTEHRVVGEVRAAIDLLLSRYGLAEVVLYGLCSGGQNSYRTAIRDERVIGLAGVDTFGYRTWRFYLKQYLPKLIRPRSWLTAIKMGLNRVLGPLGVSLGSNDDEHAEPDWEAYPDLSSIQQGYQRLVDRGVKFLYVYTGDWEHEYLYQDQFVEMYPQVDFRDQSEIHYVKDMTHICAEPASQKYIMEHLSRWLDNLVSADSATR